MLLKLTEGGEESANSSVILFANKLVLAEDVASDTLNDTQLGLTLVFQLPQAEREGAKLLGDLSQGLARRGSLESKSLSCASVEGCSLVQVLDLSGSQTDSHLHTPSFTNCGNTLTLRALRRGKDDLLGTLNLVAFEEPRGGALDELAVIGTGNLLQESGDLGLGWGLLRRGLGLLFVGSLSQEARGDHQSQQELVGVVRGQNQVSIATGDGLVGLVGGSGDDGVADN